MVMKKSFVTLVLAVVAMAAQAKPIASPNEHVTVEAKGKTLVVGYNRQKVLEIPAVGFQGTKDKAKFTFVRHLTDDYTMLSGKRLHCTNEANEYEAPLGKNMRMVMRVYNDGIAFRYEFANLQGSKVPVERTAFRIPEGTKRWMQQWTEAYEGFFPCTAYQYFRKEHTSARWRCSCCGRQDNIRNLLPAFVRNRNFKGLRHQTQSCTGHIRIFGCHNCCGLRRNRSCFGSR